MEIPVISIMNLHHRKAPQKFKLLNVVEALDNSSELTLDLAPSRSIADHVNRTTLSDFVYRDRGGLSSPLSFTTPLREDNAAIRPQRLGESSIAQTVGTSVSGISFTTNEVSRHDVRQKNQGIGRISEIRPTGLPHQDSLAQEFERSFTSELIPMVEETSKPMISPLLREVRPLGPPPALPIRSKGVACLNEPAQEKSSACVAPGQGTSCSASQPSQESLSEEGEGSESGDNRSWTPGDEDAWVGAKSNTQPMGNGGYIVSTDPDTGKRSDPFQFCIPVEDNDRALLYELEKLQGLKIGDISNMRRLDENGTIMQEGAWALLLVEMEKSVTTDIATEELLFGAPELVADERPQYQTHDFRVEERLMRMKIKLKNEEFEESVDVIKKPKKFQKKFFGKLPQILKTVRTKLRNTETSKLPVIAV